MPKFICLILTSLLSQVSSFALTKNRGMTFLYQRRNIYPRSMTMLGYMPNAIIKKLGSQISVENEWTYSQFADKIRSNDVEAVTILGNNKGFVAFDKNHVDSLTAQNLHPVQSFEDLNTNLIDLLTKYHVDFDILNLEDKTGGAFSLISNTLQIVFTYVLVATIISFIFRALSGGGMPGSPLGGLGMNNIVKEIEVVDENNINTTFADVAGIDMIKNELVEVVDYLKNPEKYSAAGARIPRGILLEGAPGTGKTLLAKAVAGESGVPFISVSGSSFIEMFVGLGAARVRKLFETARSLGSCIVFIDEIDAVGKQRGGGGMSSGGNDEREQTLNQILTEMDGFVTSEGTIVMAATNRMDLLDKALVRPGRFDRKISVPMPDITARKRILEIHARNKVFAQDVDFDEMAALLSGFSGADLQNLLNEAAILSVRSNKTQIVRENIFDAFEKIQIGLPTDNSNLNLDVKTLVAFHEAGHALCTLFFSDCFNFNKATIRATSNGAGGYSLSTPVEKYGMYPNKKFLLANIVVALAGKAAEAVYSTKADKDKSDVVFNIDYDDLYVTSGATSDLKKSNELASNYYTKWGFDDEFFYYANDDVAFDSKTSEETKGKVDLYKRTLIKTCYEIAKKIISQNYVSLEFIANYLIANQTISNSDTGSLILTIPNQCDILNEL